MLQTMTKCQGCKRFFDDANLKNSTHCPACVHRIRQERDLDVLIEQRLDEIYLRHTFVDGGGI